MRIIARYILSTHLRNFLLTVLGLSVLFLAQAILSQLLDGKYSVGQILIYNFLDFPAIVLQMSPPSVLVATVVTLAGLSRSNELTACYSIGIGLRHIMFIILSLVFMVSCFSLVLQDRILPPLFKKRLSFYWRDMKKREDFFYDVKKDKIWYRSKNLIYNLRNFEAKTKTIYGMTVYTFDPDFDLVQVTEAKKARFTPKGWELMNGTVTVFSGEDRYPLSKRFKKKELVIAETPSDFQETEKEVDGLRLKELYAYIRRYQETGADTKTHEVKFHSRISLSFIPLIMCILAIPFSIGRAREGGLAKDLGICLGLTFFYWLFYSIGLSMGTNGTLHPLVAAWLPSVIFAGVAGGLLWQQQRAT